MRSFRRARLPDLSRFAVLPALLWGLGWESGHCQAEVQIDPRPVEVAPKPGRLVGWGHLNSTTPVKQNLPQGWDAEGFIQVASVSYNWQALHRDGWALGTDGKIVRHSSPIVEIALSYGNFWLHRLEDGTLRAGGHRNSELPPEGLGEVVQIAAGGALFFVLRQDGSLVFWRKEKPHENESWKRRWEAAGLPTTGIQAVWAYKNCVVLRLRDGSLRMANVYHSKRLDVPAGESPWLQAFPGSNHVLGLTADGQIHSLEVPPAKNPIPPAVVGPFVQAKGGHFLNFAQRPTGEWVVWGHPTENQALAGWLRYHLAFDEAGEPAKRNAYVIGIQPSLAEEIDPEFSPAPEVEEVLGRIKQRLDSAQQKLAQLEQRYLEELEKLSKSAPTALAVKIAEERSGFRDLSRPAARHPYLSRLQGVYRKQRPVLEAAWKEERLTSYQEGMDQLESLQDQLTREKKLSAALEARRTREELARSLALLRVNRPDSQRSESTRIARPDFEFPNITLSERIFSREDPVVPGELVGWGTRNRLNFEIPRELKRQKFVSAFTDGHVWIAWQASGRFYCEHPSGDSRLGIAGVPSSVKTIRNVFLASHGQGYLATDRRGQPVHWGAGGSWKDSLPEASRRWDGVVRLGVRNGTAPTFRQFLALHEDGSVSTAGTYYEQEPRQWKNLAEGSSDNVDIFATDHFGGVLKKDGSLLIWGQTGKLDVSPELGPVSQVEADNNYVYALHSDGTLSGFEPLTGEAWAGNPVGLDEVVEIRRGVKKLYVLRSDGRWYRCHPGSGPPEVEEIPEARGFRRLIPGEWNDEVYYLAIRH